MNDFNRRELATDAPLGAQLNAVRRTAGLSLDEVAAITKIRRKFLVALEEGQYEVFPAEVYARGLLENYAEFLGFPPDEVLLQYRREQGIGGPVDGQAKSSLAAPHSPRPASRLTITPRTLWVALGALSLFVAVGYIVTQLTGLAGPPELELSKPDFNAAAVGETVEVEGKTDSGAELSINNQPVPTDPDGRFKEQVRLPVGTTTLRVAAKNKTGRERVVTRSIAVQPTTTPSAAPAPPAPSGVAVTVRIGPNSAYVTIVADEQTVFQGLLSPGTEQAFSAQNKLVLTTGNAGSTSVVVGGQDQGPLGQEGRIRRNVEYTVPAPAAAPPAS